MFLYWLFIIVGFIPFHIIAPYRVLGRRNIKGRKDFVIASNHRSNFDAVMLDYTFGTRIRFLAKKELFKSRLSAFFMRRVFGCVCIDRDKGITPSQYREISSMLDKNQKLGIFPEGTRNETDEMSIKGGACYFAIKYKKPIVPCFIVKKQKFMRRNHILIGEPFELAEFYGRKLDKDTLKEADDVLLSKMHALRDEYARAQEEKELVKRLKREKRRSRGAK